MSDLGYDAYLVTNLTYAERVGLYDFLKENGVSSMQGTYLFTTVDTPHFVRVKPADLRRARALLKKWKREVTS